jgi:hypothetical protein
MHMHHLSYERKADMTYRAMFGERDPQTLKFKIGVWDRLNILMVVNLVLLAHAFGVPTEKIGGMVTGFFAMGTSVLTGR